MKLGLNPYEYCRDLEHYVLEWTSESWDDVVRCLNKLVRLIRTKKIFHLREGKIEPPGKVHVPWKTTEEVVKHYFTLFASDKGAGIRIGGIDNLVEAIRNYRWAKFDVDRDKALRIIINSWKKKDDSRYSNLTKDQLIDILQVSAEQIEKIESSQNSC